MCWLPPISQPLAVHNGVTGCSCWLSSDKTSQFSLRRRLCCLMLKQQPCQNSINGVPWGLVVLIMDRALYMSIVQELVLPISAIPNFRLIARRFGVSPDTVYSIYSQDVTTRVKRRHHLLRQGGAELARRYMGGADALQLCYEVDLPPCTVMRVLLEHLPLGVPSSKVTELLRHPALLPALANPACSAWQQYCATCGAAPGSLPAVLARLQADIELCVECDACCSPASDLSRHNAGREYEARLYKCLDSSGVAYWTEDSLRSRGFFKTPDAKLQVGVGEGYVCPLSTAVLAMGSFLCVQPCLSCNKTTTSLWGLPSLDVCCTVPTLKPLAMQPHPCAAVVVAPVARSP